MIEHFDAELTMFEQNVKSGKARVKVVKRQNNLAGGGGSIDPWWLAVAALAVVAARWRRPTRQGAASR